MRELLAALHALNLIPDDALDAADVLHAKVEALRCTCGHLMTSHDGEHVMMPCETRGCPCHSLQVIR